MLKTRSISETFYGRTQPYRFYNGSSENIPEDYKKGPRDNSSLMIRNWANKPRSLGPVSASGAVVASESIWCTRRKKPKWNDCTHNKTNQRISLPVSYTSYVNNSATLYNCQHRPEKDMSYSYVTSAVQMAEASEFVRARAWASILPRFESDFKALNFLFELKDFKDVSKLFASTKLRELKYNKTASNQADISLTSRKIAQRYGLEKGTPLSCAKAFDGGVDSIAETILLGSFAIVPLLKDLAAMRAALATEYLLALDKFTEAGLMPNTRHYSEVLVDDTVVTSTNDIYGYKRYMGTRTMYTASLEYQYKYNLTDNLLAFRKYWGLTGSASEFWEGLPFSFLIDYVFNVSKALKMADRDKYLDLSVLQYCESHKTIFGDYHAFGSSTSNFPSGFIVDGHHGKYTAKSPSPPYAGILSSRYTRKLTDPNRHGITLPQWRTPSLGQLVNAAAIAKLLFL